ncbi:MAG TPA: hypothetical protein PLL68_13365, partial [Ornithinibacter sp.]|nr:hypothetical protein [Ornithinibacter sp.]
KATAAVVMSLPCLLRQSLPLITGALVSRRVAESKPWARLGLLSITIVTFVASAQSLLTSANV